MAFVAAAVAGFVLSSRALVWRGVSDSAQALGALGSDVGSFDGQRRQRDAKVTIPLRGSRLFLSAGSAHPLDLSPPKAPSPAAVFLKPAPITAPTTQDARFPPALSATAASADAEQAEFVPAEQLAAYLAASNEPAVPTLCGQVEDEVRVGLRG